MRQRKFRFRDGGGFRWLFIVTNKKMFIIFFLRAQNVLHILKFVKFMGVDKGREEEILT